MDLLEKLSPRNTRKWCMVYLHFCEVVGMDPVYRDVPMEEDKS
jgi:hypothetical protein